MYGGTYYGGTYYGGISAIAPSEPPDIPGLEYTSHLNRLHYCADVNLHQYSSHVNRLHYTTPDEDR